jgi:hypothetical protein
VGVAVYLEDQIHRRTYAGPEAGAHLARVLAAAGPDGLLAGVHPYGDTMFNLVQLQHLDRELEALADAHPPLRPEVDVLKELIEKVTRQRGYLWLSGD